MANLGRGQPFRPHLAPPIVLIPPPVKTRPIMVSAFRRADWRERPFRPHIAKPVLTAPPNRSGKATTTFAVQQSYSRQRMQWTRPHYASPSLAPTPSLPVAAAPKVVSVANRNSAFRLRPMRPLVSQPIATPIILPIPEGLIVRLGVCVNG